jgi:predicted GNAT family N-acyltransferase
MRYTCSQTEKPTAEELRKLFLQVDWARNRSIDQIAILIATTPVFVAVRLGGKLVGYGRALSDGACRALLDDIIVDKDQRGKGLGKMIMMSLMEQLAGIDEVFLNTGPHLETFYPKYGFRKFEGLTMLIKQQNKPL